MLVCLCDEELESRADEGEGGVAEVAMEPAVFPLILWVGLVAMGHGWPERRIGSRPNFGHEVMGATSISERRPRSVLIDIEAEWNGWPPESRLTFRARPEKVIAAILEVGVVLRRIEEEGRAKTARPDLGSEHFDIMGGYYFAIRPQLGAHAQEVAAVFRKF